MNYMFFTSEEVGSEVNELLKENPTYRKVKCTMDSKCDIVYSDAFNQIVGSWSGEMAAIAIEDENGQIVDRFASWYEGAKKLSVEIDNYVVSIYIADKSFYINFHAGDGWCEYPLGDFTLAKALVDQYFIDDENPDACEYERVSKIAQGIQVELQDIIDKYLALY